MSSPNGNTRFLAFLHDLPDDVNEDCAVWTDKPNLKFKFVKPNRAAELWGAETENPQMDYEKMSRALRYFYKKKNCVLPTNKITKP
ncbi:Protein CBG00836 [Caenorhabditis briggsae]|uniref:Protein CBG00836 n=1 Tax=Caenorhabditis briggsae TaxID=6238 RepID=A8WNY6_CAEBR|nr:Protein CBG00836 [Caenorhabditis briggsae]CAP22192.1 Protein CBG00836 [Caenorhabditis briggsae]